MISHNHRQPNSRQPPAYFAPEGPPPSFDLQPSHLASQRLDCALGQVQRKRFPAASRTRSRLQVGRRQRPTGDTSLVRMKVNCLLPSRFRAAAAACRTRTLRRPQDLRADRRSPTRRIHSRRRERHQQRRLSTARRGPSHVTRLPEPPSPSYRNASPKCHPPTGTNASRMSRARTSPRLIRRKRRARPTRHTVRDSATLTRKFVVEVMGLEPTTSTLRTHIRRSGANDRERSRQVSASG